MQIITDKEKVVTIINNGKNENNSIRLVNKSKKRARIMFCSDKSITIEDVNKLIELTPHECLVLMWE